MADVRVTIPEEAISAGREAFVRCPTGNSSTRVAIEAAAPLIVAAELERLAEDLQARAVARHQVGEDNGSECDDDCELSGCHASAAADTYTLTGDRLRRRATELRGGESR